MDSFMQRHGFPVILGALWDLKDTVVKLDPSLQSKGAV
jgi:hypothetical protein